MIANLAPADEPLPGLFFPHEVNNTREQIQSHIRINAARGLPELEQKEFTDRPLAIVAGGPSLKTCLPILRQIRTDCDVLAINGAYKFLRSQGVESDHFVMLDSRYDNLTHVESPCEGTNHILASQVHPAVFERVRDYRVTVVHPGTDATMDVLGDDRMYLTAPIGMASVHAIYIAAALGYRKHLLFGYDFSHRDEETYAFDQPMNRGDEPLTVDVGGRKFRTTLTLARTAEQFVRAVLPVVRGCGIEMQLYSDGLLPAAIRHANEQASRPVEVREQDKYEQMWGVDLYRKVSPGLESVVDAVDKLNIPQGATVADFGCGTGRCVKWFEDQGFDAVGVDIASNCLEESVPFVQTVLWDVENLPRVAFGFSVDVLEHIPPEKVSDTLRAIHDACSVGCYLNIDTIPDSFGVWIGQTLHLTVKPAQWWQSELGKVWPVVRLVSDDGRQAVFVCTK